MKAIRKLYDSLRVQGPMYTIVRVLQQILVLTPILNSIYWLIAPKYYNRKYAKLFDDYKAPVRPFELIWVDPQCVEKNSNRQLSLGLGRRKDFIGVSGGDWDINAKSKNISSKYDPLYEHFVEGVEWKETEFYEKCLNDLKERDETWHGCTNHEELIERFREMDQIYQDMKTNGYRTQDQFRESHNSDFIDEKINEINVDIGRDGELLFVDGRHRLIIAQLLELDEIPVICDHRHEQWMEKRDELYQSGKYDAHPDVPHPSEHR